MKGNQITQNIVNRAEQIIKKYYSNKGFGNADVKIDLIEDLSHENEMIVEINVDPPRQGKGTRYISTATRCSSDHKLQRVMKKTNEKQASSTCSARKSSWNPTTRMT